MNRYAKISLLLFVVLLMTVPLAAVRAQDDEQNYAFVIFETAVTRKGVETSSENPEERRFYVSNVVEFPSSDPALFRRASKIADEYFTQTVVEPLKAKGILLEYYDDGIRINDDVVYRLDTRAEVEELRQKVLKDLKEQNVNIFTFTWVRDGTPNGTDTSRPSLFYHDPQQPLYGASEMQTAAPKQAQTPAPRAKQAGGKRP
jgi:hypothetical protein